MSPDENIKNIQKMKERALNLKPALSKIASDMLKEEQQNFRKNKTPDGQRWQELSPATVMMKLKRGRNPNNMLRDRGLLFGSLNARVEKNTALVSTGSEIKYAATQNYGDTRTIKRGNRFITITIPARQYAGINTKDRERYNKIVLNYIKTGQ